MLHLLLHSNIPASRYIHQSNFLFHYRDAFIAWIDPHISKPVGRALTNLYNQVLDQLEVELDAMKDCLEERVSLEMKWVKTVLSMVEKRAEMKTLCDQKLADLRAERDQARQALDTLREAFEASVKGADERFIKLKGHFNKTSARVKGLEDRFSEVQGQLEVARDRVRELEASNKRLTNENLERYRSCTRAQEQADQHRRSFERAENKLRSAERKLEEAVCDASSWKHAAERARRR